MSKNRFQLVSFWLLFCLVFTTGCTKAKAEVLPEEISKKYGSDVNYFLGLQAESENESKASEKYFQKALSSKSKLTVYLAAKELVSISSEKNALKYAANLYKSQNDEKSLALYLQELLNQKNYKKIISLTKNLDVESADDEIIFYRCAALLEEGDSSFPGIYNLWCIEKPYSDYHTKIFSMIKNYPGNGFAFASEIARMENEASKREWGQASVYARRVLSEGSNLNPQVVSTAGKSLLYGSSNYEQNAAFLEGLLTGEKEVDFYLNFYAGRLYSRVEKSVDDALEYFLKAMDCAESDENYDNALWYYLTVAQQKDVALAVSACEKYSPGMHDPNYFDDFFESLSVQLLNEQKWSEYYRIANLIEKYASRETVSLYSYVAGSLIENGFYLPEGKSKEDEMKTLYTRALDGASDSYHKLMAAAKLGLSDEKTMECFSFWNKLEDFQADEEVEKIFYGYIDFDLIDYVYPFWLEHSNEIGLDCAKAVSEYIYSKTGEDPYFNYIGLRIAAKKMNYSETALDKKIMELSFPCGFSESVEKYAKEYKIEDYLIYALIRMESFYSPEAVSHAGATGLCQLMESTAAEVAKKLGKTDYDLLDPDTNIQLGSYYLSELISRLENNALLAVCSYNAGIGKIRSTLKSCLSLTKRREIPNDIFLEMINIKETRNYGKSVTAAAAFYAYLYFDKSPVSVIKNLVGF